MVSEPNENEGLVVRWRVVVVRDHDDIVQEDVIGGVRATVIHYGEALDVGAKLDEVMDGALLPLHHALFKDGWLRDDVDGASGTALLYVEHIDLADEWRERLIDLAVIAAWSRRSGKDAAWPCSRRTRLVASASGHGSASRCYAMRASRSSCSI